jgi:hypothetical protein
MKKKKLRTTWVEPIKLGLRWATIQGLGQRRHRPGLRDLVSVRVLSFSQMRKGFLKREGEA